MTEILSLINKKYQKNYFGLRDKIKKNTKVVYVPSQECFIYFYHDYGYIRDEFMPGDIMTVKCVKKSEHPPYIIYVNENKGVFSPQELLPVEVVDKEDIKKVVSFYKEYKKNHPIK
jgi:hypothetical protein